MKKIVVGIIIGIVITSVTVYALTYNASEISYKNNKTVADALDELYQESNNVVKYTGIEKIHWKVTKAKKNTTSYYSSYTNISQNMDHSKTSTLLYSYTYNNVNINHETNNRWYYNIVTAKNKCIVLYYNDYDKTIVKHALNVGDSFVVDAERFDTDNEYNIELTIIGIE